MHACAAFYFQHNINNNNKATGIGKGFGYVNFQDKSGVSNAVLLHGNKLRTREIRVFRATKEGDEVCVLS